MAWSQGIIIIHGKIQSYFAGSQYVIKEAQHYSSVPTLMASPKVTVCAEGGLAHAFFLLNPSNSHPFTHSHRSLVLPTSTSIIIYGSTELLPLFQFIGKLACHFLIQSIVRQVFLTPIFRE